MLTILNCNNYFLFPILDILYFSHSVFVIFFFIAIDHRNAVESHTKLALTH